MLRQKKHSIVITRLWEYGLRLFFPGLVSLLLALPAVTLAATPWYSHGRSHTLTLTEDGKVWAMGGNDFGQLGNGRFGGDVHEPVMIKGLDDIIAVLARGNHSVALKKDGTVWTWGFNGSGQLGDGTLQNSSLPCKVADIDNVKAIATGSGHVVVLKHDGTVWGWGGNHSGQVGNGENMDCMTPAQVPGLRDVTAIVAGAFNTSALIKDGTLWSWGFNGKGQLENGGNEHSSTPVLVSGYNGPVTVAAVVNPDTIPRDRLDASSLLADSKTKCNNLAHIKRSEVLITASR